MWWFVYLFAGYTQAQRLQSAFEQLTLKGQYHQPLYVPKRVPTCWRAGLDSVGNLFHHIATAVHAGSPWAQHCSHWCSHFPTHSSLTAKLPWCIFHDHPHPRSLQETTFFLHYLSKWGFTVIRLRVGMFMNLADLNGKLNIGNTTTFEKLSTKPTMRLVDLFLVVSKTFCT